MDNQHAFVPLKELFNGNTVMESLGEPGFGATRLGESGCADDLPWTTVGNSENYPAAAFVRQRHAILHQLIKMILAGR